MCLVDSKSICIVWQQTLWQVLVNIRNTGSIQKETTVMSHAIIHSSVLLCGIILFLHVFADMHTYNSVLRFEKRKVANVGGIIFLCGQKIILQELQFYLPQFLEEFVHFIFH